MKHKKSILAIIGIVGLAVTSYHIAAGQAQGEVDRLIGEAHGRGMKTEELAIAFSPTGEGTRVRKEFDALAQHRALQTLSFEEIEPVQARELVASLDQYYEPIAKFSGLKRYAPFRDFDQGYLLAEDYVSLAQAGKAEGLRGYLLASEGEFDGALHSVQILSGLIARMHDESFPAGNMVAVRTQKWIERILLELAENNRKDVRRLSRLIGASKAIPTHNFKLSVQSSLAGHLGYLDAIQYGRTQIDPNPPSYFFGIQYRLTASPFSLNKIRINLLQAAIEAHDTWETAKLEMRDGPDVMIEAEEMEQNLVGLLRQSADYARRSERNDLASRRALALTLAAYAHRAQTGVMPTVAKLEGKGYDATDPWNGDQMTLHEDGNQIWVGAMRTSVRDLMPAKAKLTNVLEWH